MIIIIFNDNLILRLTKARARELLHRMLTNMGIRFGGVLLWGPIRIQTHVNMFYRFYVSFRYVLYRF